MNVKIGGCSSLMSRAAVYSVDNDGEFDKRS
jgi:hypothetical protein